MDPWFEKSEFKSMVKNSLREEMTLGPSYQKL